MIRYTLDRHPLLLAVLAAVAAGALQNYLAFHHPQPLLAAGMFLIVAMIATWCAGVVYSFHKGVWRGIAALMLMPVVFLIPVQFIAIDVACGLDISYCP